VKAPTRKPIALAAVLGLVIGMASQARSEEAAPEAGGVELSDEVKRFCTAFADPARDRRYELKKAELAAIEKKVDEKVAALEAKSAELEKWIRMREEFSSKAEASLVGIYGAMRPDAAAQRMEQLGPDLAAALLLKLPERAAGVILNEMDIDRAALITNVMVAAAGQKDK
jgi:flagellar motility protein MotE (MotC chaperone)